MQRGLYTAGRGALAAIRRPRHLSTASGPTRPPAGATVEMTPELKRKNLLTALACLGFVTGVYFYSIRKLKEENIEDLEEITVVNMHESGLKATKFKGLLKESQEEAEMVQEALEDGKTEILAPEGSSGKVGWKRWVFFWRKTDA